MSMPKSSDVKEPLVVASRIKEVVHSLEMLAHADLLEALSDELAEMLEVAAARAKANGRVTIRPCDL